MATMSRRFVRSSALDRTNADVIPRCAIAHRGCATRTRVYPSSAISLSKSATADLDAQARNPYSRSWLWIPGSLAQRKIDARINFAARLAPRTDGVVDRITANY